jgi:glyoxylase-like metal-dependent hydrolase (beta-lactamase superfamily II)
MKSETTYRVGDAEITRICDWNLSHFKTSQMIPEWNDETRSCLQHPLAGTTDASGEHVLLSIHSWLVKEHGRTILIDTGAGNNKVRPYAQYFDHLQTPYLKHLQAAGVALEEVDHVLLTHLHVDHVGWNTRLENGEWIPTFPNAQYIFSRREHEFFSNPANHTERNRTSFAVQEDSISPIIDAGQAEMMEAGENEVADGFTFHATPGHSVAHSSIVFRSAGEVALFTGDLMHHPVQVQRPHWNSVFDAFPEAARSSRMWAIEFAADNKALIFSSHFSASSSGRIERIGAEFVWTFL